MTIQILLPAFGLTLLLCVWLFWRHLMSSNRLVQIIGVLVVTASMYQAATFLVAKLRPVRSAVASNK